MLKNKKLSSNIRLPKYLKSCNENKQNNKIKKEEQKSEQSLSVQEPLSGEMMIDKPAIRLSQMAAEVSNSLSIDKHEQEQVIEVKSSNSSDMLAVNDPQNFYYAYDPEERRM